MVIVFNDVGHSLLAQTLGFCELLGLACLFIITHQSMNICAYPIQSLGVFHDHIGALIAERGFLRSPSTICVLLNLPQSLVDRCYPHIAMSVGVEMPYRSIVEFRNGVKTLIFLVEDIHAHRRANKQCSILMAKCCA